MLMDKSSHPSMTKETTKMYQGGQQEILGANYLMSFEYVKSKVNMEI